MQNKSRSLSEVLDLIKEKTYDLNFQLDIPEEYKVKPEVVACVLENGYLHMEDLPDVAKNNRDIVKLMVSDNGDNFQDAPDWAKDDEEIARISVEKDSEAFKHASERLRGKRDFVEYVFSTNASYDTIEAVSDRQLVNDIDILKLVVKAHNQAFGYIPEAFRNNRELLDIVVNNEIASNSCFEFFPDEMRDDRKIALKAVADDAGCFEFLSARLRDDEELARMAVRKRGMYLEYASDRLKDDKEIVKIALWEGDNIPRVLDWMSPRLKKDKELIVAAMELDSRLMSLVDPELQADPDVIKACMKDQEYFYGDAYKYFPDSVRKDRSVALKMSAGRDFPLELCPPEFKKDREIVINAVKSSAANLEYVAPELLNDDAFIIQMYKLNNDILAKLSDEQKSRLFSFIIQSPVHFGHKWIIHMNMDMDRMSFVNPRMAAKKVEIEKDGRVIFSKDDVTLIEYDADGPVGSYLSIRSINNYVLCGAFVFWVEENSERETWSNTLSKDRHWQGYGPDVQKNDDFLKHKVELVDLESGRQEQIYFGRHKRLPDGIKVFGSVGDFEWAITLLSQEGSPESDRFIKVEPDCLEVINQQPAEIGGAARIFINEWRWLIPNSKGPMAALEVLRKTGDLEDWNWLKTNMGALSDTDMILLQEHFAEAPFAEEVRQLCK